MASLVRRQRWIKDQQEIAEARVLMDSHGRAYPLPIDDRSAVPGGEGNVSDHPGTTVTRPSARSAQEPTEPQEQLQVPTKQRPGDQPLPIGNDGPWVHREVQQDLEARLQVGLERYGQPLQPMNGRNGLQDAYEEILDLSVYLKCVMDERDVMRPLVASIYNRLVYLKVALAGMQIEAHATYVDGQPDTTTPLNIMTVHDVEIEAVVRLAKWLEA